MWEVTFWVDGVQTGERFITTALDDNIKFIEGIIWGLTYVALKEQVEVRVQYLKNY